MHIERQSLASACQLSLASSGAQYILKANDGGPQPRGVPAFWSNQKSRVWMFMTKHCDECNMRVNIQKAETSIQFQTKKRWNIFDLIWLKRQYIKTSHDLQGYNLLLYNPSRRPPSQLTLTFTLLRLPNACGRRQLWNSFSFSMLREVLYLLKSLTRERALEPDLIAALDTISAVLFLFAWRWRIRKVIPRKLEQDRVFERQGVSSWEKTKACSK